MKGIIYFSILSKASKIISNPEGLLELARKKLIAKFAEIHSNYGEMQRKQNSMNVFYKIFSIMYKIKKAVWKILRVRPNKSMFLKKINF